MLTEIIHFVREGKNSGVNPENYEKIVCIERSKNTLLTKSEKYVLSLIGQGLPNIEIANKLCMSTSTIRTFLYRIYNKLGTHRRASAVILALIQGELKVSDVYSFNDLLNFLSPLGTETIEQISQLVYNKHSQRSLSD